MGREDELVTDQMQLSPGEVAVRVTRLPEAKNPKAKEMVKDMVFTSAAGRKVGIKLVDLEAYRKLTLMGTSSQSQGPGGGDDKPLQDPGAGPKPYLYRAFHPMPMSPLCCTRSPTWPI